ncbi:putative bifunctional diguanylate cyclase/phosphodiesterase [Salinarimonas soli]|uniref:putative bifunctional diguanylate cyclase/phosphodiesterase n=1 Tax=Salinarimonas soli TaxID=1638099 RepID=UPI0016618ECF|nr:EAL domain-containing protein [Salinarimonas soli]
MSPEVHGALVDLVYASPGSVALSGSIASIAIGAIAWTTADPIIIVLLLAGVTIAFARILIVLTYRVARGGIDPLGWERRYEASSLAFACVPAATCLRAFSLTTDGGVHLLVAGLTIGYAGAIIGRGAARPRTAVAQAALMLLPLAWACSWYGALTYQVLSVLLVFFLLALTSVAHGLYEATLRTTLTRLENEGVVAELQARNRALQLVEAQRRQHAERFNAAVANMSQGLAMFSASGALLVCNLRYSDLYGLPEHLRWPGTMLDEILAFRMQTGSGPADPNGFRSQHVARATRGEASVYTLPLQDGRTMRISHQPLTGGGWVTTHEDVTEAVRAEALINYMATHDALTDLPNRAEFRDRLIAALSRAKRGESIAVLCLDLDRFKAVNDGLGHPVGDRLLVAVADRLRTALREHDAVARLGGDEFAIVQVGVAQPTGATVLAERVIEALSAPFELDGHQIVIGTSVGLAVAPHDGLEPDDLLRSADMALYRAKADGKGIFRFFEASMDAAMQARRSLETDLRLALARGEFVLHYQPIVDLRSGQVNACEALLRWRHPERGMVSPLDFIGLAEEIGLIVPIGEWVLRQACADAAAWPAPVRVAVNVSPAQFRGQSLVAAVYGALTTSGLPAARLELEITEAVMLENTEATLATLTRLKDMGARIAMDDFGTGYSSLSYLRTFPFDKIKIDGSFIRNLPGEADALAIVRAISGLGESLGMTTTAEGVETADQLDSLKAEGCREVQGYLFSRPIPNENVSEALAAIGIRSAA